MKKILIVLISVLMVVGASAQRKGGGYRYYHPRTRVIVGLGGGYYPYSYYPGTPYDYYWGTPYYAFRRPSKLQLQIEDIQADYKDRIWSARHDKSIPRSERKKEVHELKAQRDAAIRDAERNYHRNY